MANIRTETVKKLSLSEGDILHVVVGGDIHDSNGDLVTWVPSVEDLTEVMDAWGDVLPEGVQMIISHHLVEPTILESKVRMASWPPKVK